ncbi:MAG: alpha/beta hydrolase, partial [Anaerolineales bacterium]
MRIVFVFVALQAILISSCSPQSAPATDQPGITLTDCVLSSPGVEVQMDAKCGSLAVSEDPSNPQSRQIMLHVAVVEAIKRSPEPDPLFILAGGPGQSAIEVFPAISSALFRIHEKRDIVLVDQRGTGKSNPLRCLDPEADETLEEEQVIALLQDCPKKLDADLRFYTTDVAMQDLDRVRSALGYESINL